MPAAGRAKIFKFDLVVTIILLVWERLSTSKRVMGRDADWFNTLRVKMGNC